MSWPEPDRWSDAEPVIRRWWHARQPRPTRRWEEVQDHYRFGWEWGRSPTYTGLTWEQAEPDLRRLWEQIKPPEHPSWEQVKDIARLGWQRARGDSWGHDWQRATW